MKTYKTTYVAKIKAKNFQDALNISVTNAPHLCESAKTEEEKGSTDLDNALDLFDYFSTYFNPNNKK
jgi:hypothetical protein